MIDFPFDPPKEEEYELPSYKDVGRIFVEILGPCDTSVYKHEYEIHDYDSNSCVFWIEEGEGFEWWLDHWCEFSAPGFYVVEGIKGHYYRGDYWQGDEDSVDWEYTSIRPATQEEIATRTLDD